MLNERVQPLQFALVDRRRVTALSFFYCPLLLATLQLVSPDFALLTEEQVEVGLADSARDERHEEAINKLEATATVVRIAHAKDVANFRGGSRNIGLRTMSDMED